MRFFLFKQAGKNILSINRGEFACVCRLTTNYCPVRNFLLGVVHLLNDTAAESQLSGN